MQICYVFIVKCLEAITNVDKIFANQILDKGLVSKIYKYYNSTTKRQMTQFKNGQGIWIEIYPKKIYKWPISTEKDD